jgi:transcriptional regulator with XRE-family HTH domain
MHQRPLESLGATVRDGRGNKKLRETAHEIGVSAATLMRVESGRIPDVETFGKICRWLKLDPSVFLGTGQPPASTDILGGNVTPLFTISAHFRADQTPLHATVQALAQMVLFAMRAQPRNPMIEE